ncbi:MAG TPA: CmcI family methyltransferase [Solirubrobacterales bacterium]|nr:CmcI family methyltransferase [Solirubrobacterales bacterium]
MSGDAETEPRSDETELPAQSEVERVSREFTKVFHDLRKQTFSTTTWLGVQLVKTPNDILVMQQIINETKPDLIVETGVYLGGSALLFATLMDQLDIDGKVIAVDIDLDAVRDPVREHPKIELIEGSSVDPEVVARIRAEARGHDRVMVDLDADHRAHHVLEELRAYSPLVTPGCYLIVEDSFLGGRPVRPEAVPGPSEALDAWFGEDPPFVPDRWHERYLLTQNPRGYLRRVGDDAPEPRPPRPPSFMIGALELSGSEESFPTPSPDEAIERLTEAAGRPDLEVEELRRSINNMAKRDRQTHIEADLDRRRQELTVDSLLREMEAQRELLAERNRLLARERARLRRIEGSGPYRAYRGLRRIPGFSHYFHWRDRSRKSDAQARARTRAENREKQTERFSEHHRGQ